MQRFLGRPAGPAPARSFIADAQGPLSRDRMMPLLREVEISPNEFLAARHETAVASRLVAYWAARKRLIEAGRDVQPTSDVRGMLAQVREPLLSVLHVSPEFRSGRCTVRRFLVRR